MINVKTNGKSTDVIISGGYTELTIEMAAFIRKCCNDRQYALCYARALDIIDKELNEKVLYNDTDSAKVKLNSKYGRKAQQNEDNKN